MGGLSIWHWLIVLLIVVVIFGTKKLSNAGSDLGSAVKNFKKAMREGEEEAGAEDHKHEAIEGEAKDVSSSTTTSEQPKEKV